MNGDVSGISKEQFLKFNEQMLGLVRARVPLDEGLRQMAGEMGRGRLQNFVQSVAGDLERGMQLSESLKKFQPNLSDYYVALIRAGEQGGSLAEILHHVVTETRRQIKHRRVVVTSLAYPAMVILMACLIFSFVMWRVIPEFVDIFKQLGADLPVPTQIVVNVFTAVVNHFVPLVVVGGILAVVLTVVFSGQAGRSFRDALLLNFPIIGGMIYNDIAISFCRSLGFLLKRGVAMTDALALTKSVLRNVIARQFVSEVGEGVQRGESLSAALEQQSYLPPSTQWMIRLSEERGDLEKTLSDIADFYEIKNEQMRRAAGAMVEPAIIVILGLAIGLIVISLYLPIFTIPKIIR